MDMLTFMEERGYRFYQYTGGSARSCTLGNFVPYAKKEDLLKVGFRDVFFIPKTHPYLKPKEN